MFGTRAGGWWDSARVGIGPPPLETAEGWLVIYHGVRRTVAGELYRVGFGAAGFGRLPGRLLKRCEEWVLGPTEPYEQVGDVPGVVFPSGLVHRASGELRLYYGAADICIAMAAGRLDEVLAYVMEYGRPPPS